MPINETQGTRTIKNFPSKCALRHQTYKWGVECRESEPALLRRKVARAFAFVYVGSIVDQAISEPISDELRKELVSDMSSALEARQTAVDWGVAKAVADTNPFAHTG